MGGVQGGRIIYKGTIVHIIPGSERSMAIMHDPCELPVCFALVIC